MARRKGRRASPDRWPDESRERLAAHLRYHWQYYSEIAFQRARILDDLKAALYEDALTDYRFRQWQRAVKWKYGLHPLSTAGSLTGVGGRFNTGAGVNPEIPRFPALYLTADKDTALQETLGQVRNPEREIAPEGNRLTPRELALINPSSEVIVSVSGTLEKVFDLRTADRLERFASLTRGFQLTPQLATAARALGYPRPEVLQTAAEIHVAMLEDNWRLAPMTADVPALSQIFGHLVYRAGLEGILYPSRLTGRNCLVVFPHNFALTNSSITLDDEAPHPAVPRRIDRFHWRLSDMAPRELIRR